jgi:uncharacterized membrane protein YbhN (UPF0104 family)
LTLNADQSDNASRRWRLALWLKVIITGGLLAGLLWTTDLDALGQALWKLDAWVVVGALALVLLQQVVLAWRWHRILGWMGASWPLKQALRWVFVGLFFSQALPTSVGGDAVRVWALHRHGLSKQLAFGSVAVERGSGLALLSAMIGAAVMLTPVGMVKGSVEAGLLASSALICVLLAAVVFADKWLTRWLPTRLSEPGARFGSLMRSTFVEPRAAAELLTSGCLAAWLGLWAAVLIGRDVGLHFDASVFFALVGGAVLLTLLPISLGGWGVREAALVTLFGQLGAPAEPVMTMSLVWGTLPLVIALPAGLYFWWTRRRERRLGRRDGHGARPQP